MVAPYAAITKPQPDISTKNLIPVTNFAENMIGTIRRVTRNVKR
jgi:hypothetical protein